MPFNWYIELPPSLANLLIPYLAEKLSPYGEVSRSGHGILFKPILWDGPLTFIGPTGEVRICEDGYNVLAHLFLLSRALDLRIDRAEELLPRWPLLVPS